MTKQILIVDDMELNREILKEMLKDEYEIHEAANGRDAVEYTKNNLNSISAILLDLTMPEMDGYQVLEEFKKMNITGKIAILIISAETSVQAEERCFDYGVIDFIHKPFDSSLVRRRIRNAAELTTYKNSLEEKVAQQTEKIVRQNEVLREQAAVLAKRNTQMVEVLGTIVESRDLESGEHVMRVRSYTKILALEMMQSYPEYKLDNATVNLIGEASILHDFGKIAIPDSILLKPGRFTPEEFAIMKQHTTKGAEILDKISYIWSPDYAKAAYEICLSHHERYDGRGYPNGLKGDEIPISAQLVSLADVYDALVNERCYKDAFPKEKAFNMIINGECGIFNDKLIDCFKKTRSQFEAVKKSGSDS